MAIGECKLAGRGCGDLFISFSGLALMGRVKVSGRGEVGEMVDGDEEGQCMARPATRE